MSNSSDFMDCSLPGSSVHEIFQARVLEWGAIAFPTINYGYPLKKWRDQVIKKGKYLRLRNVGLMQKQLC